MKYDVIIIGAGMSGLAAGIRLAHYDKKVLICERHHRLGGLNSYYQRSGMTIETGLHAMTNFTVPKRDKAAPLSKISRQLRIPIDAFQLREQTFSLIDFADHQLRFTNDFEELRGSVAQQFPNEIDNFNRLDAFIRDFNPFDLQSAFTSARKVVAGHLKDPSLIDMLFCPLMYYGSAVEEDMDFAQFAIMYRSVFHEGFCRPAGQGILTILNLLQRRFEDSAGTIKTSCGVKKILRKNGTAYGVETDDGDIIEADKVLSSAGYPETLSLIDAPLSPPGELAFLELICAVPDELVSNHEFTISFFNESQTFDYRNPRQPIDTTSGVLCLPTNFKFEPEDTRPPAMVRLTTLADYAAWPERKSPDYADLKGKIIGICLKKAERRLKIENLGEKATFIDLMTPKTISRFTGRLNGAIYGSPHKVKDGETPIKNLFICGTDQGFLGIVGAMLSGISIANLHLLK